MPINVVLFAGSLVSVEEIATRTGTKMAKAVLAQTASQGKTKPPKEIRVAWTFFGKHAEAVLGANLGDRVVLEGRVEENKWTGRDGAEKSFVQLTAMHAEILPGDAPVEELPPKEEAPPPREEPKKEEPFDYESIPF